MRITIFGADGRTGREVITEALSRGHILTGFVYSKDSINTFPPHVRIFCGDIRNHQTVKESIISADAVVSVIGHVKGSDPLVQTKGVQNVVVAMEELGIKRLISLTGTGARVPGDTPSLLDKILNFFVTLVDKERIRDGQEHLKVLEQSSLDWSVLRVLKLNKSKLPAGNYTLTAHGPAEASTSRKKVAHIILDLIENKLFFKEYPVVSK
ncbi:MAG: NAD(P)H-binding protein [Candidatus Paceibacterota bacterium]